MGCKLEYHNVMELKQRESESRSVMSALCDPMDYTVHGILQPGILEWVDFPFSRGSSQPRDWTQGSYFAGGFFTNWATNVMVYLGFNSVPMSCEMLEECLPKGIEP